MVASAATGIATSEPYNCVPQTEDTITLLVDWQSVRSPKHRGTAVYTASWTAPLKAGVHSAQHWYYMGEKVSPADLDWLALTISRVISTSTKLIVGMMSLSTTVARRGTIPSSANFSVLKDTS